MWTSFDLEDVIKSSLQMLFDNLDGFLSLLCNVLSCKGPHTCVCCHSQKHSVKGPCREALCLFAGNKPWSLALACQESCAEAPRNDIVKKELV